MIRLYLESLFLFIEFNASYLCAIDVEFPGMAIYDNIILEYAATRKEEYGNGPDKKYLCYARSKISGKSNHNHEKSSSCDH